MSLTILDGPDGPDVLDKFDFLLFGTSIIVKMMSPTSDYHTCMRASLEAPNIKDIKSTVGFAKD